jgi:hypothetical protein
MLKVSPKNNGSQHLVFGTEDMAAASITAIVAKIVLTEFEFMAYPLSSRARHDGVAPTDYLLMEVHTMGH